MHSCQEFKPGTTINTQIRTMIQTLQDTWKIYQVSFRVEHDGLQKEKENDT